MQAFCAQVSWDINPLYAVLHESIYCQGAASHWAAQRVREQHFAAEFDAEAAARSNAPVMLTGEGSAGVVPDWQASCCLPRVPMPLLFSDMQLSGWCITCTGCKAGSRLKAAWKPNPGITERLRRLLMSCSACCGPACACSACHIFTQYRHGPPACPGCIAMGAGLPQLAHGASVECLWYSQQAGYRAEGRVQAR